MEVRGESGESHAEATMRLTGGIPPFIGYCGLERGRRSDRLAG
jgi:hypothetical protein